MKVTGRWCYLYRAIDREGELIDSMLSAHRDEHAARRFLRAWSRSSVPSRCGARRTVAQPTARRSVGSSVERSSTGAASN